MARPWITANQVTFARLLPMPLLTWWIYLALEQGNKNYLLAAVIIGTLIGSTDFVDGYLARKHGPTVLGGLLDPIADKVFIAFAYVPLADAGIIPIWMTALMFVREFLVTGLRSAYEQRNLTLKTSYFAKAKTWTQMQGIGVLVLVQLIGEAKTWWLTWAGIVLPLVAMLALWIIKRSFWRGALVMSGCFVAFAIALQISGLQDACTALMAGIVLVTWASAIDYFIVGLRDLRGRGDFRAADIVRLVSGVLLPGLVFCALARTDLRWPLIAILTCELAIGGLDNLLSHHRVAGNARLWAARTLVASALLLIGCAYVPLHHVLIWAAAVITVVGVGAEFWRGRDYYLDARIRARAARAA